MTSAMSPTQLQTSLVNAASCLARAQVDQAKRLYLAMGRELVTQLPPGMVAWDKERNWLTAEQADELEAAGASVTRVDPKFLEPEQSAS